MRRSLFILILITVAAVAFGQSKYAEIDSITRVKSLKTKNLLAIHEELTDGVDNNELKVRAFYVWITDNISYDYDLLKDKPQRYKLSRKPLKNRLKRTLKKRSAICGGYSELFRELCRLSEIHAEVIGGYSKTQAREINRKTKPNHAWNKVKLDSTWEFVDATWGSGYLHKRQFYKKFDETYFLTDPSKFYYNHYPTETNYEVQMAGIDKEAFFEFPVVHTGFFNWVQSLDDNSKIGNHEINGSDTLNISFQKDGPIGLISIYDKETKIDYYDIEVDGDWYKVLFGFTKPGNYHPTIFINSEPALTYKIKVEKTRANTMQN